MTREAISRMLWIVELAAFIALASIGLVQTLRLSDEQRAHAETRLAQAQYVARMEAASRQAEQTARSEEQRRAAAIQEIADETLAELEQARADVAAAADAGERLRQRAAALAARCGGPAGGAAPAEGGPAAPAAGTLLADVQRRLDQAAGELAAHADAAGAAGRACERAYGTLSTGGADGPADRH